MHVFEDLQDVPILVVLALLFTMWGVTHNLLHMYRQFL